MNCLSVNIFQEFSKIPQSLDITSSPKKPKDIPRYTAERKVSSFIMTRILFLPLTGRIFQFDPKIYFQGQTRNLGCTLPNPSRQQDSEALVSEKKKEKKEKRNYYTNFQNFIFLFLLLFLGLILLFLYNFKQITF